MSALRHALAVMALSLVTACATIPTSPDVGAGANLLTASQAVDVFDDVCVANRPDYNGAINTMSRMGDFTQNTQTQHYYHDIYNLSFLINTEVDGTSCVMQFASTQTASHFRPHFAALSSRVYVLQIRPGLVWVEDR